MTNANDSAMPGVIKVPCYDNGFMRGYQDRHMPGLTKLEAFTLAAMQGILANSEGVPLSDGSRSSHPLDVADYAFTVAEATIARLNAEAEKEGGK